jgi:hypothetical protein
MTDDLPACAMSLLEAGHAAARAALEAKRPPDWWPRRLGRDSARPQSLP